MLFLSQLVVFYIFAFNEGINALKLKCTYSDIARDQAYTIDRSNRLKRFVLFPEFVSWLNDWRYLHHPKEIIYWISNYYPQRIDSNYVHSYIRRIVDDINQVINHQISSVREASIITQANFHYNFFNYAICPPDDPLATTTDVQSLDPLLIYSHQLVHKNRYRAHGGISLNQQDNSTTSQIKFNTHHTFLPYRDFQYDPAIYTCDSQERYCVMDLYAIMLHETLHGFGIEHTEANLPNPRMIAVMHLYTSRVMCHDDIRAIRKVYGLAVKRENAKYDDTCRRDFPMNRLQKRMYKIHRWIVFYVFQIGPIVSFMVFLFTISYILLRKRCFNRNDHDGRESIRSDASEQRYRKQHKTAINAFLWHEDYLNG